MEISTLNNKLSTLFHLSLLARTTSNKPIGQQGSAKGFWIMTRLKEKDGVWWKRDGRIRGATGNTRKDGAVGEREGAKARTCNDRPPDYIVAQINRPSAGSLESSCGAGQESFHFRGLRSIQASDGMGPGCLPTPLPHISISKSVNNISFEKLVDYVPFPAPTGCPERLSVSVEGGAAYRLKREEK